MKKIQFVLGLVVSAGVLYWALKGVRWGQVATALREANYWLLLPAIFSVALIFACRTLRWRLLFYPLSHLRLSNLFGTLTVAYLINNTLPFQLGDLARVYLIGELEGVRKSRALLTVLVERIIDVLFLVILILSLALFVDIPARASLGALGLGLAFLVLSGLLVVAFLRRDWVDALLGAMPSFLPQRLRAKANDSVHTALDGLKALSNPLRFGKVLALTVTQWLISATSLYFVMLAFDLNVGFDAAIFVLVVVSLGFLLPAMPGSIGVYHGLSIYALNTVYNVDKGEALSFALVAHLIYYVPPIIVGLLFLWQQRLGWDRLKLLTRHTEPAAEEVSA